MAKYLEMEKEIQELKKQLNESKLIIDSMSVPIIPSIIPETVLIPIVGKLLPGRFEKIISQIANLINFETVNTVIIDFSGIGENESIEMDVFGESIIKLNNTLNLFGIDVLYTGFTPAVSQKIISSEMQSVKTLKTFLTFKTALKHVMKHKGIKLINED
ncbi:hypothetical protein [Bacillus sp. T33-2]|uniref:hypothetical protein n=1 Tax=Bacillus sp. T33-2 TaxID=2054168 RepID=UPI000C767FBE|nr:hypothetical protein [Bacillus sp. T33-2]PLR90850.1 hypothetical protein CVD19_22180 [Bacillus sp. T33-2]